MKKLTDSRYDKDRRLLQVPPARRFMTVEVFLFFKNKKICFRNYANTAGGKRLGDWLTPIQNMIWWAFKHSEGILLRICRTNDNFKHFLAI